MKKPYQKPKLTKVKLLPEEEVLKTCKRTTASLGPTSRCRAIGCRNQGAVS